MLTIIPSQERPQLIGSTLPSLGSYVFGQPDFKLFLSAPSAEFLNLQSGNARPYFYIEAIVSGVTSVLGVSYTSTNWLIDGGVIDREKPVFPGDRSNIFSSDVTIKVDNSTKRFSPRESTSIFFNNDYLDCPVNYWAGFIDVSGTALLVQRGSFVLEALRIDTRNNTAFMRLKDKFKRALDTPLATTNVSGTATELLFTGIQDGKQIMESLFITGASLTSTDIDISAAGVSFSDISFSQQSVAQAVSLIAEASDGYLFTNRKGTLTFRSNQPSFESAVATFTLRESDYATNMYFEETKEDRLSRVTIDFGSGTSTSYMTERTGAMANAIQISNDAIQGTAEAISIAGRILDRFSGQITRLEIPSVWIPSLDIGDKLSVFSNNAALSGTGIFEVYKIQEEPTNGIMRIFCITERGRKDLEDNKFFFWSDTSAVVCGTIFTGATGEANGWQKHFMFWSRDTTTGTNPGFDADGNNNNAINTGYAASGVGSTGIEVPFVWY